MAIIILHVFILMQTCRMQHYVLFTVDQTALPIRFFWFPIAQTSTRVPPTVGKSGFVTVRAHWTHATVVLRTHLHFFKALTSQWLITMVEELYTSYLTQLIFLPNRTRDPMNDPIV